MVRVQISSKETGLPSYREILQKALTGEIPTQPLHGDGSDRSFYRVPLPGETWPRTAILVKGAVPPFFEVQRLFLAAKLPVPHVYAEDPAQQAVLEEDYGDLLLCKAPSSSLPDLYLEAVGLIEQMQQRLTPASPAQAPAPFQRALDPFALFHELVFFMTHFVQGHLGRNMTATEEDELKREFRQFAESFATLPRRLCHRDYHSRNLMLRRNGRLGIVDFQDARMGPPHYDLASLLRDAYIQLPQGLEQEMLDRFHAGSKNLFPKRNPREMEMVYYRTACQRSLKALGSFGYLAHAKGKLHFLESIPAGLRHVLGCFERNPNLSPLRRALAKYVPEWE